MIPQQIVGRKRDGGELEPKELRSFLQAYIDGAVGDEQMAAFLMAVYFQGLSPAELDVLVDVMLHSGDVLSPGASSGPRVDKHSNGRGGDKVSLGAGAPGRRDGHDRADDVGARAGSHGGHAGQAGGDPRFRTRISLEEFDGVLESVGCAMIGQTDEIAPLDRRLYALRT